MNEYAKVCKFIECHATGDMNAYFNLFKTESKELPGDIYSIMLYRCANLFADSDADLKKQIIDYLRSLLPEMLDDGKNAIESQIAQLENS